MVKPGSVQRCASRWVRSDPVSQKPLGERLRLSSEERASLDPLPTHLLRKYIAYAKKYVNPKFGPAPPVPECVHVSEQVHSDSENRSSKLLLEAAQGAPKRRRDPNHNSAAGITHPAGRG